MNFKTIMYQEYFVARSFFVGDRRCFYKKINDFDMRPCLKGLTLSFVSEVYCTKNFIIILIIISSSSKDTISFMLGIYIYS
jgi:hypothetical protein